MHNIQVLMAIDVDRHEHPNVISMVVLDVMP
jgi:hypothetical protein